jgi:hypothetical protein
MTIYFCEGNYFILIILFQLTNQIPLHFLVNHAVTGEGTAAFFVAAEVADKEAADLAEGFGKVDVFMIVLIMFEEMYFVLNGTYFDIGSLGCSIN